MKKTVCRNIAVFLSAVLLLSAVGCSEDSGASSGSASGKSSKKSGGLEISFDHSYKSEKLNMDSGLQYFDEILELNDSLLFCGYDDTGKETALIYHFNDSTTTPVNLEFLSKSNQNNNNQECYIQTCYVNAENQPVFIYHSAIYDEKNEDMPYQDLGYTMEVYDSDFKLLETRDMKDIFAQGVYFSSLIQDKDGNYYVSLSDDSDQSGKEKIMVYDKDFKKTSEISGDIQYVQSMFINQDGKIVITYQDSNWTDKMGYLNPENKSIDKVEVSGLPSWFNTCREGKKDYNLILSDSTSAYGINFETGSCEEVINWINSDFIGDYINNVIQLSDGRFVVTERDYSTDNPVPEIWILDKRDPKEFENIQLISLASLWLPSQLAKEINQFNRTHSDCRIGVMDYSKYITEEEPDAGLNQFESDMTSGIVADIICMVDMPYEHYANKGLLLDLSSYVSQLNPDEYFMNYFDSLKYGDKLYRIGFSYTVQTLEAKTKHLNGKTKLSLAEFSDLIKNLPKGMKSFSSMSKNNAFSTICAGNLNSFIDKNTNTCNFNSPEFIQLLEVCNTYPDSDDAENWNDAQWEKYWAEENYQYINDKTLFCDTYIYDLKSYLTSKVQYFDKDETTLIGFPTNTPDDNGGRFSSDYTISISANSPSKDLIWEFCKSMLSKESQEALSYTFPVYKDAFDKQAEDALLPDYYMDENGKKVEEPRTIYRGEEEVKIPEFKKADTDRVKSYIENIKVSSYYDQKIYDITSEEAQKYFSGDQTAEKTAEMIQSRVSLYLSEQN